MNYPELNQPHNAQAVALFREHLPPHIADLCIENHISFADGKKYMIERNVVSLNDAIGGLTSATNIYPNHVYMSSLYRYTTYNTVDFKSFYHEFPELKPKEETTVKGYEHLVGKWVKCLIGNGWLTLNKWYKCECIDENDGLPLFMYDNGKLSSPLRYHIGECFDVNNPLDTPPTETQEAMRDIDEKMQGIVYTPPTNGNGIIDIIEPTEQVIEQNVNEAFDKMMDEKTVKTDVKVIEFNTTTTQTSETTFPRRDIVKAVKFYASLIEKHGIKSETETGQKTWGVSEDGEWLVVIKDFNN